MVVSLIVDSSSRVLNLLWVSSVVFYLFCLPELGDIHNSDLMNAKAPTLSSRACWIVFVTLGCNSFSCTLMNAIALTLFKRNDVWEHHLQTDFTRSQHVGALSCLGN